MSDQPDREALRLLRRLAARGSHLTADADGRFHLVCADGKGRREVMADAGHAVDLTRRGLIERAGERTLVLAAAGAALLRRELSGGDGFAEQHQERGAVVIDDESFGRRSVTVNHDESPLAWLRRRKDRNGRPMLDADAFAAGERLRSDYERGHLMPRVTANWTAAVAGKRRAGATGAADLTESALAARRRVEAALRALDPELTGIAVDFCCFLKGLEQIERERQWPPRSAKVVLRLALAALARHYGLATRARGPQATGLRHWGTEGYRPTID